MTIEQIKHHLSLSQVLEHYGLVPKNKMLLCPWHDDTTASLQVNLEANFYKCHACGAKGDVIQWVQDYEKISKYEALKKCKSLLGQEPKRKYVTKKEDPFNFSNAIPFLETIFETFVKSVYLSQHAKNYLQQRSLLSLLETRGLVGFNSGQFHHSGRFENETNPEEKRRELIALALEHGMLVESDLIAKTGEKAYHVFGNKSIVFPLRNAHHQIVSLYFRAIDDLKNSKHLYLKNRSGIYPQYPKLDTKKIILTESIIDSASILSNNSIAQNYSVVSCYGTNGLTEEIAKAIQGLKDLQEIVFCFDNDTAGRQAVLKYAQQFKNCKLTFIELPNKDANETLQGHDPAIFTTLLEERKEVILSNEKQNITKKQEVKTIKTNPLSLQEINNLIEKSGIIGEHNSRLLLFIIASSYKKQKPLHAIVQGSSGSGKTHLISKIADVMPQEDILRFTRITESSLYNWGEFDLVGKLLIIEDLDGLKEEALFAMRELISNQRLSSSVSIKDKKGTIKAVKKEVKGVFSSLSATTQGEVYEDNMSRSFLLAVDESQAQSQKIIAYQNQRYAGEISKSEEQKAKQEIQHYIRNLQEYEVINPFATKLQLPDTVHKKRRLNEMFQAIIQQITYLNQKSRIVKNGAIVTQIEDVEQAIEILFESIILKVDELDGSLRPFFERLKAYLKTPDNNFTQREIRQAFHINKIQTYRYLQNLLELEYIKITGGHINKGLKYKVEYWDDYQRLRRNIKDTLLLQIQSLKTTNETL